MEAITITTPTNPISIFAADLDSTEPVASTSKNASKPLSRANATIISTKKPQSRVGNQQPSAADLRKLGIKVRDFAYEKTLPPVRTVHRHRQILPGVTRQIIARQKTEEDASQSQQSQSQPSTVDRTPTEPSLTPAPKSTGGLFNLESTARESRESPTPEFPSNAQIPGPQILFDPQEPQHHVDTPFAVATPHGSLNFPHIQPMTSTSQQRLPSSPLTPAPSSPNLNLHALPPSIIPRPTPSQALSSPSLNYHTNSMKELRPSNGATSKVIPPRYHFRKRPAPPPAPTKPSKRPRKHMSPDKCNAPESSTRSFPPPVAKSIRSRNKPQEEVGSPSSPTLRQRSAASKRGKPKRA